VEDKLLLRLPSDIISQIVDNEPYSLDDVVLLLVFDFVVELELNYRQQIPE
jgi:hypothetical protein